MVLRQERTMARPLKRARINMVIFILTFASLDCHQIGVLENVG